MLVLIAFIVAAVRCNLHYEKFADGTVKCIEDEIPFDVPETWEWCRLRELFTVCSSKRVLQSEWRNSGVPFYRAREIVKLSDKGFVDNELFISFEHYQRLEKEYGVPQVGDLMVSGVGTIGKVYIVQRDDKFYYKDASVLCFQNRTGFVNPLFARFMLESSLMQSQMHDNSNGTTVDTITISTAMNYLCLIPPIEEQERIASSISALIGCVDRITDSCDNIRELIAKAKEKVLDLAIRGKLVPQNPDDEPAFALLDRVLAEKEELIKLGKIKRDKRESVIFRGEDNSYYLRTGDLVESLSDWGFDDLPDSWDVCCLGEVCDFGNCENVEASAIEKLEWILDLEDIEKDTGRVLAYIKKEERESASTKHRFHKGQVLYSKLRPYLNKVVLADQDGFCTSEILPLEFNSIILPEYARYYLMSPTFLRYANRCSYGVKMPRLGTEDGKKAIVPVPPINEQVGIVDRIHSVFLYLDSITASLE